MPASIARGLRLERPIKDVKPRLFAVRVHERVFKIRPAHRVVVFPVGVGMPSNPRFFAVGVDRTATRRASTRYPCCSPPPHEGDQTPRFSPRNESTRQVEEGMGQSHCPQMPADRPDSGFLAID